jgi:hypothetical protein
MKISKWHVAWVLIVAATFGAVALKLTHDRRGSRSCLSNLRIIDAATISSSMEFHSLYGYGEMVPLERFTEYVKDNRLPRCPSGGYYILHPVGGMPTCSFHGDLLTVWEVNNLRAGPAPYRSIAVTPNGGLLVDLSRLPVADFSPFACAAELTLEDTPVSTLEPLKVKGSNLRYLNIIGTKITDLRPLECQPLVELRFSPSRVTDGMDVLKGIKTLKRINDLTVDEFWRRFDAGRLQEIEPRK